MERHENEFKGFNDFEGTMEFAKVLAHFIKKTDSENEGLILMFIDLLITALSSKSGVCYDCILSNLSNLNELANQ